MNIYIYSSDMNCGNWTLTREGNKEPVSSVIVNKKIFFLMFLSKVCGQTK